MVTSTFFVFTGAAAEAVAGVAVAGVDLFAVLCVQQQPVKVADRMVSARSGLFILVLNFESQSLGNLVHLPLDAADFTQVSMNAMPSTPSSTVGKSNVPRLPAILARIAATASR